MFRFVIIKGIKDFIENFILNIVLIGIISVICTIFYLYILVILNLNEALDNMTQNFNIYIYLKKNIQNKLAITELENKIKKIDLIEEIKVFEEKETLNYFKKMLNKDIKFLTENYNPFPLYFEVKIKNNITDLNEISKLAETIKKMDTNNVIDEIDYGLEWFKTISQSIKTLKNTGFIFTGILIAGIILIIFNSLQLLFKIRENDLTIIKLMGAKDSFIIAPFLLEFFILGTLSSLIALIILFLFWFYIRLQIFELSFLISNYRFFSIKEMIILLLISIFIVVISTYIASKRNLKNIR